MSRETGEWSGVFPANADLTSTIMSQELVGTPLYLSPEALAGEEAGILFDLWSTVVVIYESIAGSHPFERESWTETAVASARDLGRRLRALPTG